LQTYEETSEYVRPERINKWAISMTDDDDDDDDDTILTINSNYICKIVQGLIF